MKQARAEAIFAAVFARDGGRCVYCGIAVVRRGPGLHRAPNLATLDHVIPRSQGGPTRADNLVLACAACNNARGVEDVESFRARRPSPLPAGGERAPAADRQPEQATEGSEGEGVSQDGASPDTPPHRRAAALASGPGKGA